MSTNLERGIGAALFAVASGAITREDVVSARLSILLVDDTDAYQKVLHKLLQRRGHKVAVANHGGEALKLFMQGDYDVVLMDIHMPVMNGYEAAHAIREHEVVGDAHIPIIAITTQEATISSEKCFAAGIDAYLLKPVDVAELFQLVESLGNRCITSTPSTHPLLEKNEAYINIRGTVDTRLVIDVAGSVKRLGGDLELFKEIVRIFDEDSPAILQSLRDAVAIRDGTNVERFAHSLKGLTANFGAQRAIAAAGRLEEIGRNRTWDNVDQAAEVVATEITALNAVLNEFRTIT